MVRVEWDDAWSDSEKVTPDSTFFERNFPVVEIGFLKTVSGREVVICRQWTAPIDGGDAPVLGACIRIPRALVKKITVLALSHRLRGSSVRSVSKSSPSRKKHSVE